MILFVTVAGTKHTNSVITLMFSASGDLLLVAGLPNDTSTAGVPRQAQWPPQPLQQQQPPSCQPACSDLFWTSEIDELDVDGITGMCESPRSVLPLAAPLAEDDLLGSSWGVQRRPTVPPTDEEDILFDGAAPSLTSPVDWLPDWR